MFKRIRGVVLVFLVAYSSGGAFALNFSDRHTGISSENNVNCSYISGPISQELKRKCKQTVICGKDDTAWLRDGFAESLSFLARDFARPIVKEICEFFDDRASIDFCLFLDDKEQFYVSLVFDYELVIIVIRGTAIEKPQALMSLLEILAAQKSDNSWVSTVVKGIAATVVVGWAKIFALDPVLQRREALLAKQKEEEKKNVEANMAAKRKREAEEKARMEANALLKELWTSIAQQDLGKTLIDKIEFGVTEPRYEEYQLFKGELGLYVLYLQTTSQADEALKKSLIGFQGEKAQSVYVLPLSKKNILNEVELLNRRAKQSNCLLVWVDDSVEGASVDRDLLDFLQETNFILLSPRFNCLYYSLNQGLGISENLKSGEASQAVNDLIANHFMGSEKTDFPSSGDPTPTATGRRSASPKIEEAMWSRVVYSAQFGRFTASYRPEYSKIDSDQVMVHFMPTHMQKGPDCAFHAMLNAFLIYSHLCKLPNPSVKDVFDTTFLNQRFIEKEISCYRQKINQPQGGLDHWQYHCFMNEIGKKIGVIPADSGEFFATRLHGDKVHFFYPKYLGGSKEVENVDFFRDLAADQKNNTLLHKEIYQSIHEGKIVVISWLTAALYTVDGRHAICRVFVPTFDSGKLKKIDIVHLDSADITTGEIAWLSFDNPQEAAKHLVDLDHFLEGLFDYKPRFSAVSGK